ncbi:hypothetical protein BDV12DRAFT_166080 [Aspergillus spectabilis]
MAVSQAPEFWLILVSFQIPGGQLVGFISNFNLDWAELFDPRSWVCMMTLEGQLWCWSGRWFEW